MKKRFRFSLITYIVCLLLSSLITFIIPYFNGFLFINGSFQFFTLLKWLIFFFIVFAIIARVILANKMMRDEHQEIGVFISSQIIISLFLTFALYSLIRCGFNFKKLDWIGFLRNAVELKDMFFYVLLAIVFVICCIFYVLAINRSILYILRSGIRGSGKLKEIKSNLENSRWMNSREKNSNFPLNYYSSLNKLKKDGIPVAAEVTDKNKDLKVRFNSPCHSLIIGSTGSGKTTTFVSPMIQLLAATSAGSSMVITDPKGELFSQHSNYLKSRGYDVKVIDLRDTYSSYRWNPLGEIFDQYEKYVNAYKNGFTHNNNPAETDLIIDDPLESFTDTWYEFDGHAFSDYDHLVRYVKIYKKKIYDEIYEDLNDLVSVLIPVENEKDPTWEKGARSITLAVLLAMLEDYSYGKFGMSKEKFNFFNLTKILQNSSDDYLELRRFFSCRNPLSRAYSLAKQVIDAAPQTRASYMSICYEKLTLFNDTGICALTSSSDFSASQLAEKPTALFLKIPDEKDTRHNLAAIFILNIYKSLIKVASSKKELTLDRNVYFIMDEFGNMPKISKFDKFITVGRSRKIWFVMIVQSYSQLNNVYGETIADIVKGNCGIKMFIGSNDMNTCKEYSELCGNITVVTNTSSGSIYNKDVNITSQTQIRPLIYPSELQRLNHPGDIGHSIIVTFGNYPLKTYFTPSFKVPLYQFGQMETDELKDRLFEEETIYYDIVERNKQLYEEDSNGGSVDAAEMSNDEVVDEVSDIPEEKNSEKQIENADTQNNLTQILHQYEIWRKAHPRAKLDDYLAQVNNVDADQKGGANK